MMRRRELLLAAGAAALPLPAVAATTLIKGAQTHFAQGQSTAILARARAAGLGLRFVRDEMYWGHVERTVGVLDASVYDAYAQAIRNAGLKLLLELDFTNNLYDGGQFPHTAAAQTAFARYAAYLVHRYSDILIAVELWNEPNGAFGFGYNPTQIVAPYASLLAKVYPAVRAAKPGLTVLGGASLWVNPPFHQALKNAGYLAHCNGVSFHPYQTPSEISGKLTQLRSIVGSKPLWCTEFGAGHPAKTGNIDAADLYPAVFSALKSHGATAVNAYLLSSTRPGLDNWALIDSSGRLTWQGTFFKNN